MHARSTARFGLLGLLALGVAGQGCDCQRATPRVRDWRRDIPFRYSAALDSRLVITAQRVWGTHVGELDVQRGAAGPDGGGAGVVVTMAGDHACALGPVYRYVLEAGPALVEREFARVVCQPSADGADGAPLEVEVTPYLKRVARALGYSLETWLDRGFEFSGTVTRPWYYKREFSDRFAFLDHVMSTDWERQTHFGLRVPALSVRRERTVLVVAFEHCESMGWRTVHFEQGPADDDGLDLTYHWVAGGGRFVVCEGPRTRYLSGTPETLAKIGLAGVEGFWECVEDSPPGRKDIDFRCN